MLCQLLLSMEFQVRHVHLQAERKHRSHEAEVQAYQHDWQQHVLRLKDYFERQGLQNVHPSGLHITCGLHCIVHLLGAMMQMGCQPQAEHVQAHACGCVDALTLHTYTSCIACCMVMRGLDAFRVF